MSTKTQSAVDLVQETNCSVRKAARHFDVSEAAVYAELARRRHEAAGICHCCKQPINAAKKEREALIDTLNATRESVDNVSGKKVLLDNIITYLHKLP